MREATSYSPVGGQPSTRCQVLRREAALSDVIPLAAVGAYVAAFIVVIGHYGVPSDREQVLAWTLGFTLVVSFVVGRVESGVRRTCAA